MRCIRFKLTVVGILIYFQASACDICGCSSGNYFMGPYPQFDRQFIGLQYSFRTFHTILESDRSEYSNDFYQTAELFGGTNIGNRWRILLFAPYNINHSNTDDGEKYNNGLGDITIMGNYDLFSNKNLNSQMKTIAQQLWIGGGIKFPTGKFSVDSAAIVSSANSQPGSGSFDFVLNVNYILQIQNWGINSNISYRLNQLAESFKFGNRLSTSLFIFHTFEFNKFKIRPDAGFLYENLKPNSHNYEFVDDTGGQALIASLGFETTISRLLIGLNFQPPIESNFSNGQTTANLRGMFQITYTF